MRQPIFLCNTKELENLQCREFNFPDYSPPLELFLVKKNTLIYAYYNQCPHTGANLNWNENQFLDISSQYIQCSLHFAQFKIETGECIYGPCNTQFLKAAHIDIKKGDIFLMPE